MIRLTMVLIGCLFWFPYADASPVDTGSYTRIGSFAVSARQVETDKLGNIYLLTSTNQLYKYNLRGQLLATLNYNYQGRIDGIDVSNPMEIYVFYKALNRILFLDNNLAFRGEVDLTRMGIGQATAVARSYDNGIWVFDQSDLQLRKMSKDGNGLVQSGNIRQFTASASINPTSITDNGSSVYLTDSLSGILVFDLMCNYVRTIPFVGISAFSGTNQVLRLVRQDTLCRYDTRTFQTHCNRLPIHDWIDIAVTANRIIILKEDELVIFAY